MVIEGISSSQFVAEEVLGHLGNLLTAGGEVRFAYDSDEDTFAWTITAKGGDDSVKALMRLAATTYLPSIEKS